MTPSINPMGVPWMINYVEGDLLQSPAQVLVNTVNTVGAMGKGIAKDFKRVYPAMFREYQKLCDSGHLDVGTLWLYKTAHKWVLNFPTKKHWRNPSKVEYIEQGLQKFAATYAQKGITSIAFPQLGCGNGGLDWAEQVQPLMEKYLKDLLIDVFIYTYPRATDTPEFHDIKTITRWLRSEPRQLSFAEVVSDLEALIEANSNAFRTPESDEAFCCYLHNPSEEFTLEFEMGGALWYVENWQLLLLWNQLRDFGFCADYMMPCGLAEIAPLVIALLSQLPYLRLVRLARTYGALQTTSLGVQIKPPTATHKPGSLKLTQPSLITQMRFWD